MSTKISDDRVSRLVQQCRERGLRRTELLEIVLETLCRASGPVAVRDLLERDNIRGRCDPASLYRLLSRIEDKGIARRIGLHDRAAHYILRDDKEHHDFVICVECGDVRPLDMPCPVEELEKEVSRKTGFCKLYHELQYYGLCPDCVRGNNKTRPSATGRRSRIHKTMTARTCKASPNRLAGASDG